MGKRLVSLIRWLLPAIIIGIFGSAIIYATSTQGSSSSYTILATVAPARYIVVNSNFQITEIVSNTDENVVPQVTLNTLDGPAVPYTDAIQAQYASLKPAINFSKAGIVYKRPVHTNILQHFVNLFTRVKDVIFG